MELFILRHGQATPQLTTDEARELTAKGRADVARVIEASASDIGDLLHIWVSPLVRAQQTAEIAGALVGHTQFCTTELLTPEAQPEELFQQLQQSECERLLLVSHQPLVGKLVDMLCGSAPGYHPMDTSSIACVKVEVVAPGMGQLLWLRHSS